MQFREEPLSEALQDEIHALVRGYYATTKAHEGIPPYDFDWPVYQALHGLGRLLIVTARGGRDRLRGVAIYITMKAPHHRQMLVAHCDTLSVHTSYRGSGVGAALYHHAEVILRGRGVQRVLNHQRHVYGPSRLFESLGFRAEETVYMKDL